MATYPYEDLGPERFQELCQALLAQTFPRVQCFPIGLPDGGRDAAVSHRRTDAIVFQVKFRRRTPLANATSADYLSWLKKSIAQDLPKIQALISRGLTHYILITNVPSTSHLDTGLRDLTLAWLSEKIQDIELDVWWRDDLDRRLDPNWELKRAYGLVGERALGDVLLRAMVNGVEEHADGTIAVSKSDSRITAIRKFLRTQYNRDAHVKFKQADLPNHALLASYLDILAEWGQGLEAPDDAHIRDIYSRILAAGGGDSGLGRPARRENTFSAAGTVLLSAGLPVFKRVAIEGAPGQGKSTLAQYVCQVHRARLLDEFDDLRRVPAAYRTSPVLLPFRIDLRDLAVWLNRRDPFLPNEQREPALWGESVEAFMSALISHASGGNTFTVDDLDAVLAATPTLIVFDGLDEVAEVQERERVVQHVLDCLARLEEICPELRTVVTSRPTALATSPRLPTDRFRYITLAPLTPSLIRRYTETWISARSIEESDADEIRQVLAEKLTEPHVSDLSRNAMQLAILLWLIHQQGQSLPDQRTMLYKVYVETFLNREAEKSSTVRKYRKTIIDLHGYLAWILHARAEIGSSQGNIAEEELRELLGQYLRDEGHRDVSIVDELFQGMVERVVALVSRVQGTYEFEVQPLREYFAAYHLYQTARYSPPGQVATGTKADRFDALSRNPYWLNVTRFFVGFFDKGELAYLPHQLQMLFSSDDYRFLAYPRVLASNLIADRVFDQKPTIARELAELIVSSPIGWLTLGHVDSGSSMVFPPEAGAEELVDAAKEALLRVNPPHPRQTAAVLAANSDAVDLAEWWKEVAAPREGVWERYWWLSLAGLLDIFDDLDREELRFFFDPSRCDELSYQFILGSNSVGSLVKDRLHGEHILSCLRLGIFGSRWALSSPNIIQVANAILSDVTLDGYMYRHYQPDAVDRALEQAKGIRHLQPLHKMVQWFRASHEHGSMRRAMADADQAITESLGDCWTARRFSLWREIYVISRDLRSSKDFFGDQSLSCDLLEVDVPLRKRIIQAAMRSDDTNWWLSQLESCQSVLDEQVFMSALVTFASERVLSRLLSDVTNIVARWKPQHIVPVLDFLPMAQNGAKRLNANLIKIETSTPGELIALIAPRVRLDQMARLLGNCTATIDEPRVRSVVAEHAISAALGRIVRTHRWSGTQPFIKANTRYTVPFAPGRFPYHPLLHEGGRIDDSVAAAVIADQGSYPADLCLEASNVLFRQQASRIVPVGEVSIEEGWFDSPQPLIRGSRSGR